MTRHLTRRALLASLAASAASTALAAPPERSPRPVARTVARTSARASTRPDLTPDVRPSGRPSMEEMIAASGVSGTVGVALSDAGDGTEIAAREADVPVPPASVAKALTALYVLETLGPNHRFETQIHATAPIVDGVLDGDLTLVGGGDPTLVTDHLAEIATALSALGLREVRGRFGVWGGALPYMDEIDPPQLDYLGYNPSVGGLNLNFNRVHFEWRRQSGAWRTSMDARSETRRPDVSMARMRVVDRAVPIFTYADGGAFDDWTVARGALGNGGSRWLPVRKPALYAGDVLGTFLRAEGIKIAAPTRVDSPAGSVIHTHRSGPMVDILRDMLRFSTNLTAEAVGLAASFARRPTIAGHDASARMMTGWLNQNYGTGFRLVDHSGLGDASRVTAADLVRLLTAPGVRRQLHPILKAIPFTDANRRPLADQPALVRAKTGTLNFVTTLAGYVDSAAGRPMAFAILSADLGKREAGKAAGDETPAGSLSYNRAAKDLQTALLGRWGLINAN